MSRLFTDPLELLREEGCSTISPLRWDGEALYLLDQRSLPGEEKWLVFTGASEVASAIKDMVVRGAPAIGIAASFGLVLEARRLKTKALTSFMEAWNHAADSMCQARPTAVNLAWAVRRLKRKVVESQGVSSFELVGILQGEALSIWLEDISANLAMGRHGAALLPETAVILTHCNAGALATGGYGTALGVIRAAAKMGKKIEVFADETRPWLQGARLTAWELVKEGISVTLIADSAAGLFMRRSLVDAVVVGADRIAANGDVANKIGTYTLSELAHANGVSFYVAAPVSTIDADCPSGDDIPIEERCGEEVLFVGGKRLAAEGAKARNPVFDVTPNALISGIITEMGVLRPPYHSAIKACLSDDSRGVFAS